MSLPSYKRDPVGEVETYRGGRDLQPTPFRANQLMQQDKNKRGPLQRYELPTPKFWHKHSRALSAVAIGSFIIIYTGWVWVIMLTNAMLYDKIIVDLRLMHSTREKQS